MFHNIYAKQVTMKIPKKPISESRFSRILIHTPAQIAIMSNRRFVNTAEKRLRMRQFYWDWLDESGVSRLFVSQYGGEKKYFTYVPLEYNY